MSDEAKTVMFQDEDGHVVVVPIKPGLDPF